MNRPHMLVAMLYTLLALTRVTLAETPADLAKFVIAQNADAHSKLNSCVYTFTRTYDEARADGSTGIKSTVQGEWKQRGLEKWVRTQRHVQYSDGPGKGQDETLTVFVGRQSAGLFMRGTGNPNEIEYEDIGNLPDAVTKTIAPHLGIDPMLSAFGTGDRWLTDELEKSPPHVRWEAERSADGGGKLLFVLKRFVSTRADAIPDLILSIDPDKGWLVTKQLWYTAKDHLEEEKVITASAEPAGRIWYPSKIDKVRRTRVAGGGKPSQFTTHVVLDSFKPGVGFPAGQFTVASLDFPVGVRLVRTTVTGELVTLLNGENGLKEVARQPWVASTPVQPSSPIVSNSSESVGTAAEPARSQWGTWITATNSVLLALGAAAALTWYFRRNAGLRN